MKCSALVLTTALLTTTAAGQTPATAQTRPPAQTPQTAQNKPLPSTSRPADQSFVTKAAKGGMAEVELGKLAVEKATDAEVKQFGQRMIDDHTKAGDELKALAEKKNITLPTAPDAKDEAVQSRLGKLSGEAFDRAYMQAMVSDHRADVKEFQAEAKSGKDPDVKEWAAKTLPTLEAHLKQAEDANKVVGTSGKKH
jgi:putative membrane protein